MRNLLVLIFAALVVPCEILAQDTLPRFTVIAKEGNRNLISWTNTFPVTSQISIQRSRDSSRNFITILNVPDPTVRQNGFLDAKAGPGRVFYRLFIVLDNGRYVFSNSRRPVPDTAFVSGESLLQDNQRVVLSDSLDTREVNTIKEKLIKATPAATAPAAAKERYFVVRKNNSYTSVSQNDFKKFRDSIVYATRDTMVFEAVDTVVLKPFVPVEMYRASRFVYTEKFGNVMISLPDATRKKYSVRFFKENNTPVFEIDEIPSAQVVVDKTNFVQSGWFWFELFENGTLKERHRLFIPKEF